MIQEIDLKYLLPCPVLSEGASKDRPTYTTNCLTLLMRARYLPHLRREACISTGLDSRLGGSLHQHLELNGRRT